MAAHSKSVGKKTSCLVAMGLLLAAPLVVAQSPVPQRIISLVPSVTDMLFAIGAGSQVVGIGSFDQLPDGYRGTEKIIRVGGLLDPNMERIFALRPDLVVIYESQTDPREQLIRAGILVLPYRHGGLIDISDTIRDLGERMGHSAKAEAIAVELETSLAVIRARVAGRSRPRTMLVFGREPLAMRNVYASGGVGFLHDMLDTAGGENVFEDIQSEAVAQVSSEAILTAAPEVIIEIRYDGSLASYNIEDERNVWRRLSTVPAVRTDRIHFLIGNQFVVPGSTVIEATEQLARLLHPEAF